MSACTGHNKMLLFLVASIQTLSLLFNRHAFLEFCNNEDVRRLFVYTIPPKSTLVASLTPPQGVRSKAVFFLKTNQASKLTKDNIRTDVVFTDCETTALMQLDLLVREVTNTAVTVIITRVYFTKMIF